MPKPKMTCRESRELCAMLERSGMMFSTIAMRYKKELAAWQEKALDSIEAGEPVEEFTSEALGDIRGLLETLLDQVPSQESPAEDETTGQGSQSASDSNQS